MTSFYGPYPHVWAIAGGKSLHAIRALLPVDGHKPFKNNPEGLHETLRVIGMAGPGAIQVGKDENGALVAEHIRNVVFPDPLDKDVFYIKIPIDYKNGITLPEGARRVADPSRRLGDMEPLPQILPDRLQISVPSDYQPPSRPPAPPQP